MVNEVNTKLAFANEVINKKKLQYFKKKRFSITIIRFKLFRIRHASGFM